MNKADFNKQEMTYIQDSIKFADTKAGALLGMDGLITKLAFDEIRSESGTLYRIGDSLGLFNLTLLIVGVVFLLAGIVLAIFVVFPRSSSKLHKGFIFWENVAEYKSAKEYTNEFMNLPEDEIDRKIAEENYYLATTATRKYQVLRHGFWVSSIGVSLFLISTCISYITYNR